MKKLLLIAFLPTIFCCTNKKQISWTAIGDSITYLNDHTDETGNRVKKGYLTMVTDSLSNINYTNKGFNGWTAGGIAKDFDKLGIAKSDVYTILLGTNDWWQGHQLGSLDDYKSNTGVGTVYGSFRIIIDKIRMLNKNATIILMTPLQRTDFVYINDMRNNAWGSYKDKNGQTLSSFADAVKRIADYEHFKCVDLYYEPALQIDKLVKFKYLKDTLTGSYKNYTYPGYTAIPFNPETDEYPYPLSAIALTYDGLHPSDEGNRVIANRLIPLFRKL